MKRASLSVSLAAMLGAMGSMLSNGIRVRTDGFKHHTTRSVRVSGYKGIGGRPFTRGKRSKSLRVRSNRSKAKAKARGKK